MRNWTLWLVVCVLAGAVLGCLEFDEQTVYVEHDQANDRLILIFNYMGLFAAGGDHAEPPSAADLEASKEQLAEGLELRTVAVIDTWPLAASVPELREALAEDDELPEDVRRRIGWLLDEIAVRNGGFYTDPPGRLCGAQVVIIEHASRTIPLINRVINRLMLEEDLNLDHPAERILLDRARRGQEWVKLDGHALEVSFALPEKDLVWHEDDLFRLKLGYRSMPSELVTLPALGDYRPNLEEHVAETYGLHLDARLARYLLEPDAPAETGEEQAGRLMAPRLTRRQRVRALVHALKAESSEALRAKLREEPLPEGAGGDRGDLSDDELLGRWQEWLASPPGAASGGMSGAGRGGVPISPPEATPPAWPRQPPSGQVDTRRRSARPGRFSHPGNRAPAPGRDASAASGSMTVLDRPQRPRPGSGPVPRPSTPRFVRCTGGRA